MIKSNYNEGGIWLKGNLHTHTVNSPCGHYTIETVIDMYKAYKMKYDFLAITDHFFLTDLARYMEDSSLILFQGTEYKKGDFQTLGINIKKYDDDENNIDNHNEVFLDVKSQGGFNIICHPHAFRDDYWPFERLMQLENYIGIEIFNNNVKHDNKGRAVATDLWDKLLSSGKKIFGFANDDMHVFSRAGGAFNMVLAKEKTREQILASIFKGAFYCSSGVFIENIKNEGSLIEVKASKLPVSFRFIGKHGRILKECEGFVGSYECKGDEAYVRVELIREDGAKAWTQPFWIS
ncbi:MAG: hypothetical protein Q8936_01145 [Bacillota bacterium]|nr:hypothetical protein [Bacillota bacterium]